MSKNMLIPYLKNVNANLKRKMIPIDSFPVYDSQYTCCRININIVNLKIIQFDRNLIFSLDKWFNSLYLLVAGKQISTQFPTPYFEEQNLIDLFCILLFITDTFLTENKRLNVNFRKNLFYYYLPSLSREQSNLLYQILVLSNNSCEILEDVKYDHNLASLNLFQHKNIYTASFFVPIHQTRIEKWLTTKRINHFKFAFLKKDSDNFYKAKDNKNFNYHYIPDYVFGLTDANSGQISICLHNEIEFFQSTNDSLMEWFNTGISLDSLDQKEFIKRFPVDNSIGMQDFMLLFETWILLRKSFMFRKRLYNSRNILEINFQVNHLEFWPFSRRIFTLYYFAYLYVFYFTTNSKCKKAFKYSWSKFLQDKNINTFEIDISLIRMLRFPEKFKISEKTLC
jgi:hypothetical protein